MILSQYSYYFMSIEVKDLIYKEMKYFYAKKACEHLSFIINISIYRKIFNQPILLHDIYRNTNRVNFYLRKISNNQL